MKRKNGAEAYIEQYNSRTNNKRHKSVIQSYWYNLSNNLLILIFFSIENL